MSKMVKMVTVVFPVTVNLDDLGVKVDMKRIKKNDYEYIEELQGKIKDFASEILNNSSIDPVIHSSDIDALIE